MKTCYINVTPEQVKRSLELVIDKSPDSVLVMAPIAGFETYSPSKKKPCHRIKAEIIVPEDAIIGTSCLSDFGLVATLRIPTDRINPEYLKVK